MAKRTKLPVLSTAATKAFDAFRKASKLANTHGNRAKREKQTFVESWPGDDVDLVMLADGRKVRRTSEERDGYNVKPFTRVSYQLDD